MPTPEDPPYTQRTGKKILLYLKGIISNRIIPPFRRHKFFAKEIFSTIMSVPAKTRIR
jgi:hypothetical protein